MISRRFWSKEPFSIIATVQSREEWVVERDNLQQENKPNTLLSLHITAHVKAWN